MQIADVKKILVNIVGEENVSDEYFERICYSRGWSAEEPFPPLMIVKPQSKEQICEIVRIASRFRLPISVYGGNSELVGSHARWSIALDITGLKGITNLDEQSMTVTALAGTTWEELLYELHRRGWTTGPRLHSAPSATLGGSVALCSNGPNGAKYGLVGHQVIGLEVILPSGEIVKTGSAAHRCCKQFVRYAWGSDLTGLFIGSHGIFGIITEVTLNIYPLPEAEVVVGYEYESIESAVKALYEIQRRRRPIEMVRVQVPETIELSWPGVNGKSALLPLVITGTREEVEIWKRQIAQLCLKEGREITNAEIVEKAIDYWKNFSYSAPDYRKWAKEWEGCSMQIALCNAIPTLEFPKVYHAFHNLCQKEEIDKYKIKVYCGAFTSLPNGLNATGCIIYDEREISSWVKAKELARKATVLLTEMGHTPQYMGRLKSIPEVISGLGSYMELMKALKKTIDPNNILNPGQFLIPEY